MAEHGGSWRRLVLERRLQQELEAALPPMLEEALRLARLAGPHVRRLRLDRLLQTALTHPVAGIHPHPGNLDYPAPLALGGTGGWTPDLPTERRELHMFDTELDALHEDLCSLLSCLTNLEVSDDGSHQLTLRRRQKRRPSRTSSSGAWWSWVQRARHGRHGVDVVARPS